MLRDESIDIHELNAESDTSSSDETVIRNGVAAADDKFPEKPADSNSAEEDDGEEADEFLKRGLNSARAHWIQLYKVNLQNQIVQQTFINMLRNHPQTRPIWQFTRKIDVEQDDWARELSHDLQFRHHVSSIQAALTLIMDNLDDSYAMGKLLHELGSHHFFFDTQESQLELLHEGFMEALGDLLKDTREQPDDTLRRSWNELWNLIKTHMAIGISSQRHIYLVQTVTSVEMTNIRGMWAKVKEAGLVQAGNIVSTTALKIYNDLIQRYKINLSLNIDEHSEVFKRFSFEVIKIPLEVTIDFYSPERGFGDLPKVLKPFVHNCIVLDVCPTLVRKAFMEGLITMLTQVLGENTLNEAVVHSWSKIYRVLEQAILTNIANF
ncbi:hypothetical protein M3Y99_00899500 [Aphelenchoides fujianensis]|nr:hypothetical protein M3Y99_00899500 [Aphelenchoides fujianensis]